MSSQTLFALHAIANVLITLFALGLFWHAWKTDRKSKEILSDLTAKTIINRVMGSVHMPDHIPESGEVSFQGFKDRQEYSNYLRSTKDESLLSFPEWLEKRKEAHHV